ncbi:MAG: phosphoribosylglycinamide formyltransferase [Phycisphaerae bacterium SM23_33]|nr:MAG: phosphoribosylglycinamide formyltransferase [Phycisphaerae bacterium SM23_33]
MSDKQANPIRLGVLLSGGGRTLLNILEYIKAGKLPAQVAVVLASRDCKGVERARAAGLEVHVVPYKEMPDLETYSARLVGLLDAARVDLVCLAGFLSFWRIPDRYLGRVMNIHPALLPRFGGEGMYGHRVHEAVLAAGCKVSGCTVHFVNNEYDAGPIIVQKAVPVLEGDTPDTLAARVFEQECVAYPEAIRLFAEGRVKIDGSVVHVLPE